MAVAAGATPHRAAAEPVVFELAIRDARVAGATTLRARRGADIVLRWTTDRPHRLHLHGYEIELSLGPGQVAEMQFTASNAGRFPVEIHGHDAQGRAAHRRLLVLEIRPE